MTISRGLWRVNFIPGQTSNYHNNLDCFGWIVQQSILPVGNKFITISKTDVSRNKSPNLALYVGGRATVVNDLTGIYPDRVAGMFTGNRPDHPAGVTTITAVEELELWCFNWLANRRRLPVVSPFILQENETITPSLDQRIFICKGQINNYFAADQFVSDGALLTAASTTYGFYVESSRNV